MAAILALTKELQEAQDDWIEEKLQSLLEKGFQIEDIDVQFFPNLEVKIIVGDAVRFSRKIELET